MKQTIRLLVVLTLLVGPTLPTATAQVIDPLPPLPPCPWWDCGSPGTAVVEDYRIETTIERRIATTHVTQILRNDGDRVAEGEFLFPLPTDAAASDLRLWIDGEPISGDVLEADEARRTYEEIVRRTLDPALLEFVDDGLLRLSVFPIEPGDTRRVEVEYTQVLEADSGLVRYRHPMGREHGDVTFESVTASISIIEPTGVKSIYSPTHPVGIDRDDPTSVRVGYEATGASQSVFGLTYSIDESPVSLDVMSYRDGDEGWFLLLASPGLVTQDAVTPKDVALVIDVSGSMEGDKLSQAKSAAAFVLDNLNPTDRFAVLSFSTGVDRFADGLRPAADSDEAISWVDRLAAAGATDIESALSTAFSLEDERPLYVLFITDGLPTDGVIDTDEILESLAESADPGTAVFSFGVGYDVDTVLLDSIAEQHQGSSEYVFPDEQIDDAVAIFYSKVASPVVTDIDISVDGVDVWDLQPQRLPDLFSGEQLVVVGRYDDWGPATIRLTGTLDNEPVTFEYENVRFTAVGGDSAVPGLWATRKIGTLLRQIRIDGPDDETIDQIVRLSIRYGIVTPYTSFLVTEPAPFGEDAIGVISERAASTTTIASPSGEAAVAAADAAGDLADSERAATDGATDLVVTRGARSFRLIDGVWIDTTYDPDMAVTRIGFGSGDYFELANGAGVAEALALAPRMLIVFDGTAFEIVGPDEAVDALPEGFVTEPGTTGPDPGQAFESSTAPAEDDDATVAAVALLSAMAAVAGLTIITARR